MMQMIQKENERIENQENQEAIERQEKVPENTVNAPQSVINDITGMLLDYDQLKSHRIDRDDANLRKKAV